MNKLTIFTLSIITFFTINAMALDRLTIGKEPSKLYKELLESFDKNDDSKCFQMSAKSVCDISDDLKEKYNIDFKSDIKQALKFNDFTKAKQLMLKFVYYDTKNVFLLIKSELPSSNDANLISEWLKVAYSNYVVISPELQAKDMMKDLRIRKMFTSVFTKLSDSGYTNKSSTVDDATKAIVKETTDKIVQTITEAFPEYK
jgi:hypothetical protein